MSAGSPRHARGRRGPARGPGGARALRAPAPRHRRALRRARHRPPGPVGVREGLGRRRRRRDPARGRRPRTCASTRAATSACSASARPAARGAWASSTRPRRGRDAAVLHAPAGGLAVATSGAYERGAHIVDPRTARPPRGLLSVTVCGPDLGTADAYATAAFAMGAGRPGLDGDAAGGLRGHDDPRRRHGALDAARWTRCARGSGSRRRPRASRSCARRCANGWPRCAASRPSACRRRSSTSASSARACPGGDVFLVRPVDWEQLRHEEGGAGRGVPYWATPWPSGAVLAGAVADDPPPAGARVLELGCGLGLPSIVAARGGRVRPRHRRILGRGRLRRALARAQRARRRGRRGRLGHAGRRARRARPVGRRARRGRAVPQGRASRPRSRCCRGSWPRAARSAWPTRGARAPATSSPPPGRASPCARGRTARSRCTA